MEHFPPASSDGSRVSLWARVAPVLFATALMVGSAAAQSAELLPPENKDGIKGAVWTSGFITLLLISLVFFAGFLKTKRGHQD